MKIKLNERMESELVVILDQLNLWKEKSKTYNEYQITRFKRMPSNCLYEWKNTGFFCGLKSEGLIIPKGKKPTHDHVYSRKLISDRILEEHLKESLTIDKLREILPVLLTSIILSPEDNKKLAKQIENQSKYVQSLRDKGVI